MGMGYSLVIHVFVPLLLQGLGSQGCMSETQEHDRQRKKKKKHKENETTDLAPKANVLRCHHRGGWVAHFMGGGVKHRSRQAWITVCSNTTSRLWKRQRSKKPTRTQEDVQRIFGSLRNVCEWLSKCLWQKFCHKSQVPLQIRQHI